MSVKVTFVGSGDAFGSGGQFQTCIIVDAPGIRFAIDFGTSSLVALNKLGIAHNTIDAIVLTHLHGDHCGGIPFLLMDAMLGAKRQNPLVITVTKSGTGSYHGLANCQDVYALRLILMPGFRHSGMFPRKHI